MSNVRVNNSSNPVTTVSYNFSFNDVITLGNNSSGNLVLCTLDPRILVRRVFLEVLTVAQGIGTLNVSVGRVSSSYDDYILSSDLTTINLYGVNAGTRGVNMSGYDVPSITSSTDILMRFVCTGGTLQNVTNLTFKVTMELSKI